MSTAPSAKPLFQYIPGIGRIPVIQCPPCPTGPTGFTGPSGQATNTGATGPTGPNPTSIAATAFSTSDQTLTEGIATLVRHDSVPFSYGITTTTGLAGSFTVPSTGVYKIIPSIQLRGSNQGTVTIWIKNNGSNLPDTATLTHFKQNDEVVITCEYLLELSAGDALQVWAVSLLTNCSINHIAAGGVAPNDYPAAPGVITNMYKIR